MREEPVDLVDPLHPLRGEVDPQAPVGPHGGRRRRYSVRRGGPRAAADLAVVRLELGEVVLHDLGAAVTGRGLEQKIGENT